mgnify:CR=1 FL=1
MKRKDNDMIDVQADPMKVERALLVGLKYPEDSDRIVDEHLDELASLSDTLGIPVVDRQIARLRKPQSRFLVGSGKAEELAERARTVKADVIIMDEQLSPSQQRNWEQLTGLAVIDRQEVILDIFAERAQTREAVLQVSLARAEYDLPRLKRKWTHLSRQAGASGGAATRGEGEQQIEVDSRLVRNRIAKLQSQLDEVRRQRRVQRKKRLQKPVPVAAIVGYTNAGKSSLLNTMTDAHVFTEDKLFATLDPTVRRVQLPNRQELLLADTVGFVRKLPHQLVEAFKATLEEAAEADFLIEVLDVTDEWVDDHHETTRAVLAELDSDRKPVITVFNKIDLVDDKFQVRRLKRRYKDAVFMSARSGEGHQQLVDALADELGRNLKKTGLLVPHHRYDVTAMVHRTSHVHAEKHTAEGTLILASLPGSIHEMVRGFENKNAESIDAVEIEG